MGRYCKLPVMVEAHQLSAYNGEKLATWCKGENHEDFILIQTLEGEIRADVGDFIIQGVSGEFYPCKPEIFWKTYQKVGE